MTFKIEIRPVADGTTIEVPRVRQASESSQQAGGSGVTDALHWPLDGPRQLCIRATDTQIRNMIQYAALIGAAVDTSSVETAILAIS